MRLVPRSGGSRQSSDRQAGGQSDGGQSAGVAAVCWAFDVDSQRRKDRLSDSQTPTTRACPPACLTPRRDDVAFLDHRRGGGYGSGRVRRSDERRSSRERESPERRTTSDGRGAVAARCVGAEGPRDSRLPSGRQAREPRQAGRHDEARQSDRPSGHWVTVSPSALRKPHSVLESKRHSSGASAGC